jgi:hypothetical protein
MGQARYKRRNLAARAQARTVALAERAAASKQVPARAGPVALPRTVVGAGRLTDGAGVPLGSGSSARWYLRVVTPIAIASSVRASSGSRPAA